MTEQSRRNIERFQVLLSIFVFTVSILVYWIGINFLRDEVFSHYYNPRKHLVVDQNPDTKEIYAWKDINGKTYTPEDAHVKNFTWGTTLLLLFVMIFAATVFSRAMDYYTRVVLQNEIRQRQLWLQKTH
ncbi:MAG: hypothetical protein ACOY30_08555 [Bacillota bacterium]